LRRAFLVNLLMFVCCCCCYIKKQPVLLWCFDIFKLLLICENVLVGRTAATTSCWWWYINHGWLFGVFVLTLYKGILLLYVCYIPFQWSFVEILFPFSFINKTVFSTEREVWFDWWRYLEEKLNDNSLIWERHNSGTEAQF